LLAVFIPKLIDAATTRNYSHASDAIILAILAAHRNAPAPLLGRRRLRAELLAYSGPAVNYERELGPLAAASLRDFPCPAYHEASQPARCVATPCSVACGTVAPASAGHPVGPVAACPAAAAACRAIVECTTVLVRADGKSAVLKGGGATLRDGGGFLQDDSTTRLVASPWWGTPQLP